MVLYPTTTGKQGGGGKLPVISIQSCFDTSLFDTSLFIREV